jgi:hypothetical protein
LFIFAVLSEVGFESLCKFAAGEHDASSTAFTFKPDICAKTDDSPFVGTAWMLLAKAQVVVQSEVGEHVDGRLLVNAVS